MRWVTHGFWPDACAQKELGTLTTLPGLMYLPHEAGSPPQQELGQREQKSKQVGTWEAATKMLYDANEVRESETDVVGGPAGYLRAEY